MEIGPVSNHRPENSDRSGKHEDQIVSGDQPKALNDRVEISETARQLLAARADEVRLNANSEPEENGDSESKIEQIRLKILSGYYDNPDVLDKIAGKLLDDIDS